MFEYNVIANIAGVSLVDRDGVAAVVQYDSNRIEQLRFGGSCTTFSLRS